MKALVTGGTGFVGANIVRHLLARGDEVRCVVRATSPSVCLDGLDVERVEVALTDPEGLRRAMAGVDGVFHIAGTFHPGPGGEALMRAIHVDATDAICRAATDLGIRVLVCSSSVTVGFGDRAHPGDEDTPVDADRIYGRRGPLRAYYDTKVAAEGLARDWSARGGEVVVANPDFVVGPWDVKPTSGALVLQMARRWVPVHPRGGKCFINAADCAEGHLRVFDAGVPGRRYLLGHHNLTYREFMRKIAQIVGGRPPVLPIPRAATHALGLLGRVAVRVSPHGAAQLEPHVLAASQQRRFRTSRRAVEELGCPVTPIEDGIRSAYAWFGAHGYL